MRDVAERPQSLVREAVVIAFLFFLGEPHPAQRISRILGRNAETVEAVDGFAIRITAPMRDPGSVRCAQHWFESRDQTTGRHNRLHRPALMHVAVGLSVRNYKQPALIEPAAYVHGEP